MRSTIRVTIAAGTAHAVATRRTHIVWESTVPVAADGALADTLATMLSRYSGVRGARAVVRLGAGYARVRRLVGLEHVARGALATEAARASAERFFVGFGGGTAVSNALRAPNGSWYAAAYSSVAVSAVNDACKTIGVQLDCIVPDAASLTSDWKGSAPAKVERALSLESVVRVDRSARSQRAVSALLWCLVASAAAAAIGAPTISAELSRRDAERSLVNERREMRDVAASMAELAAVSKRLDEIDGFASSRRSMLQYLASLADALPESTAVLSLRADSVAATVVLITRVGPTVLEGLASVEGTDAPQILGPLSRERIGAIELERIATRARFKRQPAGPARGALP